MFPRRCRAELRGTGSAWLLPHPPRRQALRGYEVPFGSYGEWAERPMRAGAQGPERRQKRPAIRRFRGEQSAQSSGSNSGSIEPCGRSEPRDRHAAFARYMASSAQLRRSSALVPSIDLADPTAAVIASSGHEPWAAAISDAIRSAIVSECRCSAGSVKGDDELVSSEPADDVPDTSSPGQAVSRLRSAPRLRQHGRTRR